MTHVTMLGVTGGAGTTTLAALLHLRYRNTPNTRPSLSAHNTTALHNRIGSDPAPASPHRSILDAGRANPQRLHTAITNGVLLLITPLTTTGHEALHRTLTDAKQHVPPERLRAIAIIYTNTHNPRTPRTPRTHPQQPAIATLPHDPALATGTHLITTWNRITPATHTTINELATRLERSVWATPNKQR